VRLIDANLLVYGSVRAFPQHEAARGWLEATLNGPQRLGLPWASLLTFVRIVSNPRIFERPKPVREAWRCVEAWLDCPGVWVPLRTERHREVLRGLLADGPIQSNLVPDAHLAALAIEHGLILCSTDGDFARFPGLRWENPLA
jgi:toxin-antitoxin system PIN domain toxin